jgi:Mn-dependent DtxR family transcriptional regulator
VYKLTGDYMQSKKERWSEENKQFLKSEAGKMKDQEIASVLNRSLKSVREMRRRLGLIKLSGRGRVELRVQEISR